jgi:hypothetical protein
MMAITRFVLRAAAVIAFSFAVSTLAFGQTSQQIEEAKAAEMLNRAGMNERRIASWELRMAEVRRPPKERRDASLAYTQIREDYKQIQIVNNDLARAVDASSTLDIKYIEKSVSEIKKRALRLKENLMLPEAQKAPEPQRPRPEIGEDIKRMKSSLVVLDNLVMGFINNSIFDQTKAVNLQAGIKARRDLEEIIELSEHIKKSSEKLKNIAQKTQ